MKQWNQESNDNYLVRFKTNIAAVELTGGKYIFASPIISGLPIEEILSKELEEEVDKSKAIILLKCADDSRFSALSKRLKEATYLDRNEYPTSIATMYELMTKSCSDIQTNTDNNNSRNRHAGLSLLQQNESSNNECVPGTDGGVFDIVCYNCNRRGEASNRAGISNLQYGYMMTQTVVKNGLVLPDWVLLDTCSTDNVLHNFSLVTDIKKCTKNEEMKIHTNGGSLSYNTIGKFKYLPIKCYFNSDSIANVLSLESVTDIQGYEVSMDTNDSSEIHVEYGDTNLVFRQSKTSLYYCIIDDLRQFSENVRNQSSSITLLSTSDYHYSNSDIKRAKLARNLQNAMMWPSSTAMKNLVKYNLITDKKNKG